MKWITLLSLLSVYTIQAQLPDSLSLLLNEQREASAKLAFLDSLSDQLLRTNLELHLMAVNEALTISRETEEDSIYHHFCIKIGTNFLYQDRYDTARTIFQKVINDSQSLYLQAVSYSELGASYYYESNDAAALENMIQSFRLWTQLSDTSRLAGITNNIGVIHRYLEDYENSNRYLKKAIFYKELLGEQRSLGSSLHNLGINYDEIGKTDSALLYLRQALSIRFKYNDQSGLSKTYNSLGVIYNKLDQLDSAEFYFRKAVNIDEEIQDLIALPTDQLGLSEVLAKQGKLQESTALARNSLSNTSDVRTKISALQILSSNYDQAQDFKRSSQTKELLLNLKDSINTAEKQASLQELQVQFDTQQKEAAIAQLSAENKIQQLQAEKDKQTRYLLIIIAAALVAISLLLYTRFRRKAKTNELLDLKNQELAAINRTKDRLFSIISHDLKSPLSSFHLITQSLTENLDSLEKNQIKDYLESLRDSSASVRDMMDNLLKWALAQTNQLSHKTEAVEVNRVFKNVISQLESISNQKAIQINSSLSENLCIQGDSSFLEIVLRNLLSNSLKFTETGKSITIESVDAGDQAILRISDEGIGMDQKQIEDLLSGKIIGQEIQNSSEKGTGLGVTLVKELVAKMGGNISVSSAKNQGTTFELYFKKVA